MADLQVKKEKAANKGLFTALNHSRGWRYTVAPSAKGLLNIGKRVNR
jgi:hypothetical protein